MAISDSACKPCSRPIVTAYQPLGGVYLLGDHGDWDVDTGLLSYLLTYRGRSRWAVAGDVNSNRRRLLFEEGRAVLEVDAEQSVGGVGGDGLDLLFEGRVLAGVERTDCQKRGENEHREAENDQSTDRRPPSLLGVVPVGRVVALDPDGDDPRDVDRQEVDEDEDASPDREPRVDVGDAEAD